MPAATPFQLLFWSAKKKLRKRFYTVGDSRLYETVSSYFYETRDPTLAQNSNLSGFTCNRFQKMGAFLHTFHASNLFDLEVHVNLPE